MENIKFSLTRKEETNSVDLEVARLGGGLNARAIIERVTHSRALISPRESYSFRWMDARIAYGDSHRANPATE